MIKKEFPLVSIVLATYNRVHLIGETLRSISDQSYQNWECLIIDDGSVDGTEELVQTFIAQDKRFHYYTRNNNYKKGLPGSRNYGLSLIKGEYIVFFDDDDIIHPALLQDSLNAIKASPSDFCRYEKKPFTGKWFPGLIDNESNFKITKFDSPQIEKMITGELAFASCCVLWDKKCFNDICFNEELQYAEEWECYSRILMEGYTGISLDKILYYNRKHPNSNTGEFWNNDPVRRKSKVKAVKLVIDNLKKKQLLSENLIHYFLRLGFQFKETEIIDFTLKKSKAGIMKSLKYKAGYLFYPIIKPLLNLKGKFS